MKIIKAIGYILFVNILVIFGTFASHTAKITNAGSVYDQGYNTSSHSYTLGVGTPTFSIGTIPVEFNLTNLTFYITSSAFSTGTCETDCWKFRVNIYKPSVGLNVDFEATNLIDRNEAITGYYTFTQDAVGASIASYDIDGSELTGAYIYIYAQQVVAIPNFSTHKFTVGDYLGTNTYIGNWNTGKIKYVPYIVFNGTFSNSVNYINWQTPQFDDGFSSPDFSNWWTCINIVNGASGGSAGYNVKVHYGTSTTTMNTVDQLTNTVGYAPITSIPTSDCALVAKSASSTPGTYYAYSTLWRHSTFGTETNIATSSVISFEITAGNIVVSPGTPNDEETGIFCSTMGDRFPFAYLCDMTQIVDDLVAQGDTTASATALTINIPIGNSTTSYAILSDDLLHKFLTNNTLDNLRDMISWSLWIGFFIYVYKRIKSLGQNSGEE